MSKTEPELKPCPFCGETSAKLEVVTALQFGEHYYRVRCTSIKCFGPETPQFGNEADAISAWNRRPQASGEVVSLQAVIDILEKRAEYFEGNNKGHFDRDDAARSYRATAKEISATLPAILPAPSSRETGLEEALVLLDKFVPDYADWMDKWADDAPLSLHRTGNTFGDLRRARALITPDKTEKTNG